MPKNELQINCDLGEGVSWESELIPWIDAASVACGGHYGDRESISKTLSICQKFGKRTGAHPSYPDRANFGRVSMKINSNELIDSLYDQINTFETIRKGLGLELDHIKFHGALYNDAAKSPELAQLLVEFIAKQYPQACLFVPPQSETEKSALLKGMKIRREIFGDRAYGSDLKLRPRSEKNSLFDTFEQVDEQMKAIFEHKSISTPYGKLIRIQADTICFHGDNQASLEILPQIRKKWWN